MERQLDMFGPEAPPAMPLPAIEGFGYAPGFCPEDEAEALIAAVDASPWTHEYARRRQHYGLHYDARGDRGERVQPLPAWLDPLLRRLVEGGIFPRPPQTCLVNEYLPGQGIALHVDRPRSGSIVASLSLGSGCTMDFAHTEIEVRTAQLWLAPRSLLHLRGPARTVWKHGIAKRKADWVQGRKIPRARRLSITLRLRDLGHD